MLTGFNLFFLGIFLSLFLSLKFLLLYFSYVKTELLKVHINLITQLYEINQKQQHIKKGSPFGSAYFKLRKYEYFLKSRYLRY